MTKYCLLLLLVATLSKGYSNTLYHDVITAMHKGEFSSVVQRAEEIEQTKGKDRSDLMLALAYAYFNEFQFQNSENILSKIKPNSPVQESYIYQIQGLTLLYKQDFSRAVGSFKKALTALDKTGESVHYYQALNNYVYALYKNGDHGDQLKTMVDNIIYYSRSNGDSILLASALMNKAAIVYSNNSSLLMQAYPIAGNGLKSSLLLILANSQHDLAHYQEALKMNPLNDYNIPTPLKHSEKAEIILNIAEILAEKNNYESLSYLKSHLADTALLSAASQNKFLAMMSRAYLSHGYTDSSTLYVFKMKKTGITSAPDQRAEMIPLMLSEISSQESNRIAFLYLGLGSAATAMILTFLFFRLKNKNK
jgi:tetratricopeptide (TPR) repeat protein